MEISTFWTIVGVFITTAVPSLGGFWFIANKLGIIESNITNIKDDIGEIKTDVKELKSQVNEHESRLCVVENNFNINKIIIDKFAPAHSPRKINHLGQQVIKESGIWRIIEKHKNTVDEHFRKHRPTNMYDAQEEMFKIILTIYNNNQKEFDSVKDYAIKQGLDFNLILFLAGLKLRDEMFPKIGFKVDLLDK